MKSKSTAIWFVLALLLAAAIWVLENYFQNAPPGEQPLLAGLRAGRVTDIQIVPAGTREISATRTNHGWRLQEPVTYPAQAAAIDGLLDALEKLKPSLSISPGEMNGRKNADAEFGFDNPQFTVDVAAGEQNWHLRIGNKTAPGDGVYVRAVGSAGAFVTGTVWLQFLPHDATDWRDTTLVDMPALVDWLIITNGSQAIELRRDVTNRLWQMIRPQPARANNIRIVTALEQLRTANVSRFVSDDPKADRAAYGLEPAALDVWLGSGTNLLTGIHVGKEAGAAAGEVFARREGWNAIVAVPGAPLEPWKGMVNDFRDPNLLELTAPVAEVEVRGEHNFTLQQHGTNAWVEVGEKFPVDPNLVMTFIRALARLRIADFVQDVVTASGLQSFGLSPPSRQITLRAVAGDTNSVITRLLFGTNNNNGSEIYVKRSDEDSVYAVATADMGEPSLPGDFFRAHQLWNFSETNVAQVTLRQNGRTRQITRTGANDWSLSAGQGIITPAAVEETVHRLGDLSVLAWIGRGVPAADLELSTNKLSLTIELKSGGKYSLDFGKEEEVPSLNARTALTVTTLEGERWAFLFPPVLYPMVQEYLSIPPDAP